MRELPGKACLNAYLSVLFLYMIAAHNRPETWLILLQGLSGTLLQHWMRALLSFTMSLAGELSQQCRPGSG